MSNELYDLGIDKDTQHDVEFSANIISGKNFKDIMYSISHVAAEAVVKTLGPYGATTVIDDGTFTYPTKDGWSALNRIRFNDPVYHTIFGMLKQVSFNIVTKVGDGTTSALIGADLFLHEVLNYQRIHRFRQTDFTKALEEVKSEIIDKLLHGDEIFNINRNGDYSDIYKIAYISSNGNEELSTIIQDIYQKTQNPHIYVTMDPSPTLHGEIQEGYRFDGKILNHSVYINDDDKAWHRANPMMIAIFDHNMNYSDHKDTLSLLLSYAEKYNTEILIVAPHFDDTITSAIGTSIMNLVKQGKVPHVAMMQVPMSTLAHRNTLKDLSLLTGSQIMTFDKVKAISALTYNLTHPDDEPIENGFLEIEKGKYTTPEDILDVCIGRIIRGIFGKDYGIIQDYDTTSDLYKQTLSEITEEYQVQKEKAEKSSNILTKDYMAAYERYIKFLGKIGTIFVGGESDIEKHYLKDTVDDAVLACRTAYDDGYICGLNLSTLRIIHDFRQTSDNDIKNDIYEMLFHVFYEMSMLVMENKYDHDTTRETYETISTGDHYTVSRKNEDILNMCIDEKYGYNLVTETFECCKFGPDDLTVINPVTTDIEILKGMISILTLLLTSNQFISTSQSYDRKSTKKHLLEEKTEIAEAQMKGYLSAIDNRPLNISLNFEGVE